MSEVRPFVVNTYERNQPLVEMTVSCAICGHVQTVQRLPGAAPKYCPASSGEKFSPCQREAAKRRAKAWRDAQQGQSQPSHPAQPVVARPASPAPNLPAKPARPLTLLPRPQPASAPDELEYVNDPDISQDW